MREYVDAAARHNIRTGVFYSVHFNWYYGVSEFVVGHPALGVNNVTQDVYNRLAQEQLEELLNNYGPLGELWFDGGINLTANALPVDVVQALKPRPMCHSCINCTQDAVDPSVGYGIRWMGNEEGSMPLPSWSSADNSTVVLGSATGGLFMPASCDTVLHEHYWFYSPASIFTMRSLTRLVQIYLDTVGRGCNLILNMAPNAKGAVPIQDAMQYYRLGSAVRCVFGGLQDDVTAFASSGGQLPTLTWDVLPGPATAAGANVSLALWENLEDGQLINAWLLEARSADGAWFALQVGQSINHKRILFGIVLPVPIVALRLIVLSSMAQADQSPLLRRAQLYDLAGTAECDKEVYLDAQQPAAGNHTRAHSKGSGGPKWHEG